MNDTPKRPNIIVLVSHDTGRHVSPYGIATVDTPNFERLAAGSLRFVHAHSCAPQCSPARAALFSGQYPHQVGVMGNIGREHGWTFPRDQRHAGRIFGELGYQSWLLGLQHESYEPETLGFDRVDLGFSILDAAAHLDRHLDGRDPDRPFYCQLGCHETHRPWDFDGTEPDDRLGVTVPPYLNDGPATRADLARFQGSVKRLDTGLGRILDLLDRRGLARDTLLIVTTDHGIAVPHAKATLLDTGTGVFLFMRWPRAGWRTGDTDALVSHVDVLPTVLAALGAAPEPQMAGRSFLPLLEGADTHREAVFSEKTFFQIYDPMRAVRTRDWLYIKNFELCRWSEVGLDCLGSGSVGELGERWAGGHPADELYAGTDPWGERNLADDPAHAETLRGLQAALGRWMRRTRDPLLAGPVQSPYHRREVDALLRAAERKE